MIQEEKNISFKPFLDDKQNIHTLLLMLGIFTGYELCGVNGVMFYAAYIFKSADTGVDAKFGAIFIGIFSLFGCLVASVLVDRIGRRILLIVSFVCMGLSFIVMGVYFNMLETDPAKVENWKIVPVIVLCFYMFINLVGCSTVCFVLLGEMFAHNVKTLSTGIAMCYNNLLAIYVSWFFPFLADLTGFDGVFFVFAAFNFILGVYIYFFLPETKGKTFREIQDLLKSKRVN